ncbi:MAG: sigma-70 family RNA polymerase sigma factor [Ruminiclostridium sp.]|nr:sigma-70 family RNA polymerase sigma factor [Ruminiclostridium sp.]
MTESELDRYMRLYYKSVYAVALCCCKNPDDSYDIAQEVFLKLYTCGTSFTDDEHIKAWLLRCAVNKSIDHVRSHWYRFSRPLEAASGMAADETQGSDLLPMIMKLDKKYRVALYLHYYEEYPVKELAEMLGISEQALRSRLRRGRDRLKKIIGNERNG